MFEPPRATKRRRGPTTMLTTLGSSNVTTTSPSLFNFGPSPSTSTSSSCFDVNVPYSNSFEDDSSSSSDTDDIMHRIKKEAKRLLKRKQEQQMKQLHLDSNNNTSKTNMSPDKLIKIECVGTNSSFSMAKRKEVPLFTMSQVNAICEKMVKEREAAIREQYDKILTQKLSEQYDAFVKFTHEQLQRRFENSQCSYVS